MYISPIIGKAKRFKKAKMLGSFRFGCDAEFNRYMATTFAIREQLGDVLSISARCGNSTLPEFCIISGEELLKELVNINKDAPRGVIIIELRSLIEL